MNEVKLSKKLEKGGRRVTADLARDVIEKLDKARVHKGRISSITETLEQIIKKADLTTLWEI